MSSVWQIGASGQVAGILGESQREDVIVKHLDRFYGGNFTRKQMGNTQGRSSEGKKSVRFLAYVEKRANTYFKFKCDTELWRTVLHDNDISLRNLPHC